VPDVTSTGRHFIGMSPLNRGRLVDRHAKSASAKLAALKWAFADTRVSALAITMSSVVHVREVIGVVDNTMPNPNYEPSATTHI
jgi:aryl-alcohol dehydrogenase-like predicted oxidoreductase